MEFDNAVLTLWWDSWIVVVGFIVALGVAVLVAARSGLNTLGLLLKTLMVVALLLALPVAARRVGIEVAIGDDNTAGWLSLVGVVAALVVGLPYLLWQSRRGREAAVAEVGAAEAAGEATPPEGVTLGPEAGPATATLADAPAQVTGEQPAQAPTAWLLFRSGPNTGQSIPLKPGETSIGRAAESDVVVDDPAVSRHHARITLQGGQYLIEDAGSSGGTLVEGTATMTHQPLTSGATIQLGQTELVFMQAEPTSATRVPSPTATGARPQGPGETQMMEEEAPPVMAWLAVRAGPQKGRTFSLSVRDTTIGRDTSNDIVLEDNAVSRRHALLRHHQGAFLLLDMGSRGGTRVNDQPLEIATLPTGGTLQVGRTRLTLVYTEAQEPAAPGTLSGQTMVAQPSAKGGGLLVVQAGPDTGKSFPLAEGDNHLGRDPSCPILLSDSTISRYHALIRREGERVMVFDLGSQAGTRVDGQPLAPHPLKSGDIIALGRSELVFMQVQAEEG